MTVIFIQAKLDYTAEQTYLAGRVVLFEFLRGLLNSHYEEMSITLFRLRL